MSTKETLIRDKFNGDEEAYKQWMRSLGSKGGKLSKSPANHPARFDNNKALAKRASKKGLQKRWGKVLDTSADKRKINREGN